MPKEVKVKRDNVTRIEPVGKPDREVALLS